MSKYLRCQREGLLTEGDKTTSPCRLLLVSLTRDLAATAYDPRNIHMQRLR